MPDEHVGRRIAGEVDKEALLTAGPETYFTTDHDAGCPAILARLAAIAIGELTGPLTDAWRIQAPKRPVKVFDATEG